MARRSAAGDHEAGFWDPQEYGRFRAERSRPFFDLLGRIPDGPVRLVADLGCGTGELTLSLLERWPRALVWGVDRSPDMLAVASRIPPHPNLRFVRADLLSWEPEAPLDRIVSNAVLQWVADHAFVLRRLSGLLAPGGVLALQMPNNSEAPAHRLLAELSRREPWASLVGGAPRRSFVESPEWYARRLDELGLTADVWETIYHHRLGGPEDVLAWMKGTALRPLLARLGPERQGEFLEAYASELRRVYPAGRTGTIFPFRRLFLVARRN
jgi:trans-aconitate 2-methyltransferase